MSMLTEQCARLRSWARQFDERADLDALAPLLAMDLREAADTIILLRDRLQDAELGSGTCELKENKTAIDDNEAVVSFICSKCGHGTFKEYLFRNGDFITYPKPNYCPHCGAKVEVGE